MAAKEVRSELRTKHALATMGLFAVATMVVVGFSVTVVGVAELPRAGIWSALLWIVLLFSAMSGLTRVFVKEEDARTVTALRLSGRSSVIFCGKLLFNAALMAGLSAVVLPLFALFFQPTVARWDQLILLVVAGGLGLSGASTLLAALVAKTGSRGALFVVLALPVLLPLLVMAMAGTTAAIMGGRWTEEAWRNLIGIFAYALASVTASLMLFPFVWDD